MPQEAEFQSMSVCLVVASMPRLNMTQIHDMVSYGKHACLDSFLINQPMLWWGPHPPPHLILTLLRAISIAL